MNAARRIASYTDIIAAEIHAAGWSYGTVGYRQDGRDMFTADAGHADGWRCVARAETELTALPKDTGTSSIRTQVRGKASIRGHSERHS